jgi:hypothetical protein
MVKFVPVLGTIVLIAVVVQLILGFQVAADVPGLRDIHVVIGILGIVLVLSLVGFAFKSKTGTVYSKITMIVLTLVVAVQIGLGYQLLEGAKELLISHEVGGFLILLLSLLTGGLTFWTGARKTQAKV